MKKKFPLTRASKDNFLSIIMIVVAVAADVRAIAQQDYPACITNVAVSVYCEDTNLCSATISAPINCYITNTGQLCPVVEGGTCLLSSDCQTNDGVIIRMYLYAPAGTGGYQVGDVTIKCSDGSSSTKSLVVPNGSCAVDFVICATCPPCNLSVGIAAATSHCPCEDSPIGPRKIYSFDKKTGRVSWSVHK